MSFALTNFNYNTVFCYLQQVYKEARQGFEDTTNTREKGVVLTKEDKAHGSLLVIQELVRNGCSEGEVN